MARNLWRLAVLWAAFAWPAISAWAQWQEQQDTYLDPSIPEGVTVRDIIGRFAAQEKIFKQALDHYTYREVVRMQTLTDNGFPDGEYDDSFDVTFNNQGERTVKQVSRPRDTLKRIRVTPEDIDDIRNRLPFVLTTDEIPDYNIKYRGQQNTSGTHCYVFDISPKAMEEGRRYFEGRIWVDAQQYQIVKSSGKPVPDIYNQNGENLFPSFTTYRNLVDGKYWFPSYTKSDDYLHFSQQSVHVIETVDYTNYKRFGAESRIIFDGHDIGSSPQQPGTQTANGKQYPSQAQGNNPPSGPGNYPQQRSYPQQQPAQQAPHNTRTPPQSTNPPQQPAQYVEQALMSLENEISDAVSNREVSILERVLTDDYHLISANGDSEDKFSLLDDIHQNRAGTFAQPQNMQVLVNGDRATLVGIREESVPVGKNKVQTGRVRFTDTFVRRAGEWFLSQTKEAPAR
jgi:Domain of unknown function (DUF4440)